MERARMNHSSLLEYLDENGVARPVRTAGEWDLRRKAVLAGFGEVMGPLPALGPAADVRYAAEEVAEGYRRRSLSFGVGGGKRVPAYLLLPQGPAAPGPAVLCLHQTTKIGKDEPAGLGGKPNLHYAHELALRGFVCLVPDYPSFGEYPYDFSAPPFASGVAVAVHNNRCAIDVLQSLNEVAPDRIGCIGHSLGGHTTIFTAMHDQRIRAAVSSCGFSSCETEEQRNALPAWSQQRYMPRVAEYGDMRRLPFDFHELVASLAPRAFLAVAPLQDTNFDSAGAREVVAAAGEVYGLLGAPTSLEIRCPEADHDFPLPEREYAYDFLERSLGVMR